MAYKISWHIEDKILLIEVWGEQTLDELKISNAEVIEILDKTSGEKVHIVVNDEKMTGIPLSIAETQKVLTYPKHPKMGWVVMVGEKNKGTADKIQDYIITLFAKILRARYTRVKTFDEALNHLQYVGAELKSQG